jgi:hypothetical protein
MKLLTSKERLPFTFIYLLTLSGEVQLEILSDHRKNDTIVGISKIVKMFLHSALYCRNFVLCDGTAEHCAHLCCSCCPGRHKFFCDFAIV